LDVLRRQLLDGDLGVRAPHSRNYGAETAPAFRRAARTPRRSRTPFCRQNLQAPAETAVVLTQLAAFDHLDRVFRRAVPTEVAMSDEFDLLIRGGTLVDGTGAPGRAGDVAIRGGKIAALGDVRGRATTTVDASGCVVAPGFVDIHTHYDAQVFWDRMLTISPW